MARGARRPLIEKSRYSAFHGKDGMGDLGIPPSKRIVDHRSAVELIRDLIEASPDPVIICPLAPLTNIALFLRSFPETAKKVRIVLMGGSASAGNATALAEFNIWHDPEAAAIVFSSGVPISMYGLDVFWDPVISVEQASKLQTSEDPCANFAGKLIAATIHRTGSSSLTIGDAGALVLAIFPHLFTLKTFDVVIDTSTGPGRGQTIVDRRPIEQFSESDVLLIDAAKTIVALNHLDVEHVQRLWLCTIDTFW